MLDVSPLSSLSFVICLPNAQLQLMSACDISSLSGALWLNLALSGSLWLSQALSGSPNLLTKPLLGSQGPCSARSSATALQHFLQPCLSYSIVTNIKAQVVLHRMVNRISPVALECIYRFLCIVS